LSMIRSTHKCKSGKTGKGFVNSLINSHLFEAHCGDKGINPLDTACYDHDILHATRKHLEDRHKVLELRTWERFKAKDTPRKEKIVAYTVINAMKAKRKIGMGCKRKRKRTTKIKINGTLLILTPGQSGGTISLIPIFAGLSALGSLMSGSASVCNAIQNSKRKKDHLTSRDIIKYVAKFNISHFRGVFSRDNLPKKPLAIECGILNLDVSSGNGSHWVAFYKIKDKVEYFDSFGDLPPPIELQNYFKGNKIKYNYTNYQDFNSFNCGHLCFNFYNARIKNSDRLLNNNKFPICSITLKKGCYDVKDIKNQILTQIDDFNNDNDYFGIKSTEKLTFDIGIDQIDFRTTIFSNGIIRFNINNSIGPLLGFEKKVMNHACTLMVIDHRK
ncbi:hypothetical protein AGLY_017089, partial [Aphis glycines]